MGIDDCATAKHRGLHFVLRFLLEVQQNFK